MAARFDASRAQTLGQNAGDGTPIMLTIPTKEPWVPLRILGLGLGRNEVVNADVFLLTDHQPKLLAGGPGLSLDRNEAASDLAAQRPALRQAHGVGARARCGSRSCGSTFPPGSSATTSRSPTTPNAVPKLIDAGVTAAHARPIVAPEPFVWWPIALGGRRRPRGVRARGTRPPARQRGDRERRHEPAHSQRGRDRGGGRDRARRLRVDARRRAPRRRARSVPGSSP